MCFYCQKTRKFHKTQSIDKRNFLNIFFECSCKSHSLRVSIVKKLDRVSVGSRFDFRLGHPPPLPTPVGYTLT